MHIDYLNRIREGKETAELLATKQAVVEKFYEENLKPFLAAVSRLPDDAGHIKELSRSIENPVKEYIEKKRSLLDDLLFEIHSQEIEMYGEKVPFGFDKAGNKK